MTDKTAVEALNWQPAPLRTEWGAGMMVASIALSKDETADLYAHRKALPLVGPVLASLAVSPEPRVIYSPIETRPHLNGKHPNDNEPRDADRHRYLDERGDDSGQGLDCYWKWGHAAGWNDHKRHVAGHPVSAVPPLPDAASHGSDERASDAVEHLDISKDYTFDSAHALSHLPATHKCHHMHGHTYGLRVIVRGEVDAAMGWVQDYADISGAVKPLLERIDHQNLNEILPCITTAENLAIWIFNELKPLLPMLSCTEIKETASSLVTYRP